MSTILVLGAYGLIGTACVRALEDAGHRVLAFGRSEAQLRRAFPGQAHRVGDLGKLSAVGWAAALSGVDVVVNAAGALQDGGRDDLRAVHVTGIARLLDALGDRRLVQISAVGAAPDAATPFLATKGEGDALIRDKAADWVILRPGLVIGPGAYGGTALLRAAAALPVVPEMLPGSLIQTVALSEVAQAVCRAVSGDLAAGTVADLVEPEGRSLPATIRAMRRWLGMGPAPSVPAPGWAVAGLGRGADLLSALGWRSPLRSTALRVLATGVRGDPCSYDRPLGALERTLAALPATVQERWFARVWPWVAVSVAGLSVFWIASGVIGLIRQDAAMEVLTSRGYGTGLAAASVTLGALADIALGAAVLWRPWARTACLGMAALAAVYLLGGTVMTPDLWADPLGPLTKVLPAILLPLMTRALLEAR